MICGGKSQAEFGHGIGLRCADLQVGRVINSFLLPPSSPAGWKADAPYHPSLADARVGAPVGLPVMLGGFVRLGDGVDFA